MRNLPPKALDECAKTLADFAHTSHLLLPPDVSFAMGVAAVTLAEHADRVRLDAAIGGPAALLRSLADGAPSLPANERRALRAAAGVLERPPQPSAALLSAAKATRVYLQVLRSLQVLDSSSQPEALEDVMLNLDAAIQQAIE